MLVSKGLTESLAGRFESIRVMHWSFPEMQTAFGWDVDRYIFWGGDPGGRIVDRRLPSLVLIYILDSLIETTIARDILLWQRIEIPVLLRRLFELGCTYSGRFFPTRKCWVSYKMLGTR